MNEKYIFRFGDTYVYDDGSTPSEQEILEFEERRNKLIKESEKTRVLREEYDTNYATSKLDGIKYFFDYSVTDDEGNMLSDDEIIDKCKRWDREDYIYKLSTELFDCFGHGGAEKCVDDLKQYFPDLYIEALEGFYLGQHDT